jgi:hypothetical protein
MHDRVFERCWAALDGLAAAREAGEPADALAGADDWFTWNSLLEAAASLRDETCAYPGPSRAAG